MANLSVTILRYLDDAYPGWVECAFRDAFGREHLFREKLPIVTNESLDADSGYPRPGTIACENVDQWKDDKARVIVRIDTDKPWGCESIEGVTIFDVLPEQIRNGSN
jgi:hypothetical protein